MKTLAVVIVVVAILLVAYFYLIYKRKETDAEKSARIDCNKYASLSTADKAWCQSKGKTPKINLIGPKFQGQLLSLSAHQISTEE